ncbi:MAG TPA: hypothetical protein VIL20_17795 [Sandaracinaceae bacterium]
MERRAFLSTVALGAGAAGAGAIWLPGCGAPSGAALGSREVDDLLGRLERGVRSVRESPIGAPGRPAGALAPSERLLRVGLEALVVADVARSIPPGAHLPGELAVALDRALPVLDHCVVGYHTLLDETPRVARRKIDRAFRSKPGLAMDVAEAIDDRAADIGISRDSRLRLRRAAANVGTRVRRQSAGALIDDCVAKMESVAARSGADVRAARSMTAQALVAAIWQQVEGNAPGGGAASSLGAPAPAPSAPSAPEPPPVALEYEEPRVPAPAQSPGDTELIVGGTMLGAGLAVFGIGGIISLAMNSPWPVVVAATPGGVAVIIGIILLIVGAVQNANA